MHLNLVLEGEHDRLEKYWAQHPACCNQPSKDCNPGGEAHRARKAALGPHKVGLYPFMPDNDLRCAPAQTVMEHQCLCSGLLRVRTKAKFENKVSLPLPVSVCIAAGERLEYWNTFCVKAARHLVH